MSPHVLALLTAFVLQYGRIINISSAAGIYGNFGQANYSAAKLGLYGFSRTLSIEGAKYNILVNTIAPIAASQMTATVMPPEILDKLQPEYVAPLVAYLVSASNSEVTGQLIESGAGFNAGLRRQRTKGHVFRADETFTPAAVKAKIDDILDFDGDVEYPTTITDANHLELLERAKKAPANEQGGEVRFDGKTVLITGAGAGLGKAYALLFGKAGANVVVNDFSEKNATEVVDAIKKAGGKAAAAIGSVEDGQKIVDTAVKAFGGLHVVINNAGILRDKSFASMTDDEWKAVVAVHLRGTYSICKAAWPIFLQQKYGRIVNTTSAVGLYGNFGQANYSTAKAAILGLTQTLSIEGAKYNILANTIAPNAGTAMTATIWPQEMVDAFKPDFVAPLVAYLASADNEEVTKGLFEVSGGWVGAVRWERAGGVAFSHASPLTPEKVAARITRIFDFDPERASWPADTQEALGDIMANLDGEGDEVEDAEGGEESYVDPEDPDLVKEAKQQAIEPSEYSYEEKDVILYNLGVGAHATELQYTYEQADEFQPLPTFGVIPQFAASASLPLDWLPNFSPMMLLHGEQYLKIYKEIPVAGTLVNKPALLEVLDKGKAAAVTTVTKTYEKDSGDLLFENQSTVFIRGAGGFGGKKTGNDRGEASAVNTPPSRKPDAVVERVTNPDQAALYRLSGDFNPLHIDPDFAKVGGFPRPIIHGLCTFAVATKAIVDTYGPISSVKVRFASTVFPGETVVTELWKEDKKVFFTAKVKETGKVVLSHAAATLA